MSTGDNQVTESELERIMSEARKMQSDASRKGRDDLVDKARGIVDHLSPGEQGSTTA